MKRLTCTGCDRQFYIAPADVYSWAVCPHCDLKVRARECSPETIISPVANSLRAEWVDYVEDLIATHPAQAANRNHYMRMLAGSSIGVVVNDTWSKGHHSHYRAGQHVLMFGDAGSLSIWGPGQSVFVPASWDVKRIAA